MMPARLGIRLRQRERLAERTSALRGDHDHPSARRSLQHKLPLLVREVGLARHRPAPFTLDNRELSPTRQAASHFKQEWRCASPACSSIFGVPSWEARVLARLLQLLRVKWYFRKR